MGFQKILADKYEDPVFFDIKVFTSNNKSLFQAFHWIITIFLRKSNSFIIYIVICKKTQKVKKKSYRDEKIAWKIGDNIWLYI